MKILVIGAGVSGLTTSLVLHEQGHEVTIWAKDMPAQTTSAIAAAFWEPYLCEPKDKALSWSLVTNNRLKQIYGQNVDVGIRPMRLVECFDEKVQDPWWRSAVEVFGKVNPSELVDGYVDAYYADVFLMDTSLYLPWLKTRADEGGIQIVQREITSFDEVPSDYDAVINCTGLGARSLCDDDKLYPVRGQVLRVASKGLEHVIADDEAHNNLAYIIPRYSDTILGGTAQVNDWNLEPDEEDTRQILEKAALLSPQFKDVDILEVKVGLRPARDAVRLELEVINDLKVIHNYGHGGAGYTLSWGCAEEVAELIKTAQS